jgi:hypothetical protein
MRKTSVMHHRILNWNLTEEEAKNEREKIRCYPQEATILIVLHMGHNYCNLSCLGSQETDFSPDISQTEESQ